MTREDFQNSKYQNMGIYLEQLKDKRWKEFRKKIIARDNGVCQSCQTNKNLQVHHKQYNIFKQTGDYKEPWGYSDRYLITFCQRCHEKGHEKYGKVPVKYI